MLTNLGRRVAPSSPLDVAEEAERIDRSYRYLLSMVRKCRAAAKTQGQFEDHWNLLDRCHAACGMIAAPVAERISGPRLYRPES